MSTRLGLTIGLTLAAVAVGGWRMIIPGLDGASNDTADSVSSIVSSTMRAAFTGAEASLAAQRTVSGSYAGTPVQPPLTLVRADAAWYSSSSTREPCASTSTGLAGFRPGAC